MVPAPLLQPEEAAPAAGTRLRVGKDGRGGAAASSFRRSARREAVAAVPSPAERGPTARRRSAALRPSCPSAPPAARLLSSAPRTVRLPEARLLCGESEEGSVRAGSSAAGRAGRWRCRSARDVACAGRSQFADSSLGWLRALTAVRSSCLARGLRRSRLLLGSGWDR